MTTKIPVELSSTPGIVDGSNATAITIDSSERVNIGKTSAVTGHPIEIQANASGQGLGIYGRSSDDFSFLGFYENGANTEKVSLRSDGGALAIKTSGTEAVRIDSSQNVGIGTTSPSTKLEVNGGIRLSGLNGGDGLKFDLSGSDDFTMKESSTNDVFQMGPIFANISSNAVGIGAVPAFTNGSGLEIERAGPATLRLTDTGSSGKVFEIYVDDATGNVLAGLSSGLPMIFKVINSERMRIDTSGRVLIGRTTDFGSTGYKFQVDFSNTTTGILVASDNTASKTALDMRDKNVSGTAGNITYDGLAAQYNTSSDYRLKENIQPLENGLKRLNNLKPIKFNWKEDGKSSEGFIAHEAQEVFPDAVTGEKDGEEMQGMDYGRITPLLVKAIQEQQEQIEQLKTEIQTLKGE